MPLRNRVTPFGKIIETPARGAFMGNRGKLHDENKRIIRESARPAWILCVLDFRGRHRTIMAPGAYTELFFLDEATAFAAGHRPCATCRKEAYSLFKSLWNAELPATLAQPGSWAQSVDRRLHEERLTSNRGKRVWSSAFRDLPDGTMVAIENTHQPMLVWNGKLLLWETEGYRAPLTHPRIEQVQVLTPPSIVNVLRAGYTPHVHSSAFV